MDEIRIEERHLKVDGQPVRVLEAGAGAGPPLVLLASVFINADVYRPTIRELARRFRVYAVDLPGSGGSDKPDRVWGFDDFAEWVPGLLFGLDLAAATVIGHSYSGAVALLAASRTPDRFRSLVLVGSVGVRPRSLPALAIGLICCVPHEPKFGDRTHRPIAWNLLVHPKTMLSQLGEMAGADLSAAAAGIRAPTLIAWGKLDRIVPLEDARKLQALIPSASLVLSEGSHNWLVTHPREFADAVIEFCAEPTPAASEADAPRPES